MKDTNGNIIEECQELGTRKYNIKINNRYLVGYEENESKSGKGAYSNGSFDLQAIYNADTIIVSNNKEEAYLFDGRINVRSEIEKILKNFGYKFFKIEIIELGE